jgi:hypothetical protein
MKKSAILSIFLVGILLTFCGYSAVQAAPQELASSTQKIVNLVKAQDNSVFDEIQKNIDMVNKLKSDIETGGESDKKNF